MMTVRLAANPARARRPFHRPNPITTATKARPSSTSGTSRWYSKNTYRNSGGASGLYERITRSPLANSRVLRSISDLRNSPFSPSSGPEVTSTLTRWHRVSSCSTGSMHSKSSMPVTVAST